MNLDNYFARFLHKSNGKAGTRKEEATPSLPVHVTPARAAVPPLARETDSHNSSAPTTTPASQSLYEAAVSALPHHNSPDGAETNADNTHGTSLKRQREDELATQRRSRGRGNAVADADGSEEEDDVVLLPSSPSAPSPPPHSIHRKPPTTTGRTLTRRQVAPPGDEDEDDELAMLIGSQNAREVKEVDAMMEGVARAGAAASSIVFPSSTSSLGAARTAAAAAAAVDASTACAVGSLAWHKATSRSLETFATYFHRQFEFSLHTSSEMFNVFEPFFKDRALRRIAEDREARPVFFGAPTITSETVAALPGCLLRSYQVEGVQFLLNSFHRGMSCILGDDMGLGKTAQVSAFLHTLKQLHGVEGPHLILAPLSTLTSWTRELARWAPQLRVVKYHGERQARQQARAGRHNRHAVFVTTPAVLNQEKGFFRKKAWVTVVVDEAHVLKSHNTAVTSVSRKLTACHRIAVTGTPVHNRVQEVWSLMSFLYPWLMAGYDPSDRDHLRQAEECAAVLRVMMLRRTKADMELGIPPRIDEPVSRLQPTYVQRQLLMQLTTHALEEGGSGHQLHSHLSHQRVVCNHPLALRLLADEGRTVGSQQSVAERMEAAGIPMDAAHIIDPSAKMRHLCQLLPALKAEGHRCLIFSNFTTTLDLLEAMCVLCGYTYERLDGSCNRVERELSMLRFNHPRSSCFLFLVTTTAGGVGVTLTGADTVILFDAHFNPQLDRQAADRAHRIGQTRTVHVHRLCLQGTVEEHIREIAARKASLGDFIVEGGGPQQSDGAAGRVTAEDIREMFRALEQQKSQQAASGGSGSGSTPVSQLAVAATASSSPAAEAGEGSDGHQAENAMVADLLRVEERGLPGSAAAAHARRAGGGGGGLANPPKPSHVCFCCGGIMHALEPLYHCMVCPKAYHAGCIGERRPKPGEVLRRQWTCPRHGCSLCGKLQAADGAIFMCDACPRSFCFDCLDPRYLEMASDGTRLLHVRSTYAGMEEEEVAARRSCYYITCLRCCGVVAPSSSSSEGGEEGEESGEDDSDAVEVIDSSDDTEEEEEDDDESDDS